MREPPNPPSHISPEVLARLARRRRPRPRLRTAATSHSSPRGLPVVRRSPPLLAWVYSAARTFDRSARYAVAPETDSLTCYDREPLNGTCPNSPRSCPDP